VNVCVRRPHRGLRAPRLLRTRAPVLRTNVWWYAVIAARCPAVRMASGGALASLVSFPERIRGRGSTSPGRVRATPSAFAFWSSRRSASRSRGPSLAPSRAEVRRSGTGLVETRKLPSMAGAFAEPCPSRRGHRGLHPLPAQGGELPPGPRLRLIRHPRAPQRARAGRPDSQERPAVGTATSRATLGGEDQFLAQRPAGHSAGRGLVAEGGRPCSPLTGKEPALFRLIYAVSCSTWAQPG
jgi:hypothetical protein